MSALELLLNENKHKTLTFGSFLLKGNNYLKYKHDDIYSILTMLGDQEITYYMSNGLIFELKLINNVIRLTAQSVDNKPNWVEYEYAWI